MKTVFFVVFLSLDAEYLCELKRRCTQPISSLVCFPERFPYVSQLNFLEIKVELFDGCKRSQVEWMETVVAGWGGVGFVAVKYRFEKYHNLRVQPLC